MRSKKLPPKHHPAQHPAQHPAARQHEAAHQGVRAHQMTVHQHRQAVFGGHGGHPPAIELEQQLFPYAVSNTGANPGPGTVWQFKLNNVGLVRGLEILIRGTVTGGGTSTQTLTPLGIANALSLVDFQDFSSYHRVTTAGWHLNLVQSSKERYGSQTAVTSDSGSIGFANNNPATISLSGVAGQQAKSSIAASASANFQVTYRLPFCRDRFDLRGGIWAKKTGASAFAFLTLNPTFFCTSSQDPTLCVYQSGGNDLGTLSNLTIEVYQDYMDFFPKDAAGDEIVPWRDLEEAYLLNNTQLTGLAQNQDNLATFTDERQFLSVAAIYDNAGTLNFGTDVLYWAVKSANLLPIFQRSAFRQLSVQRVKFHDDLPKGMYHFAFDHRPIDTLAFGNTNLVLNPSNVAGASAVVFLGYESFGRIGAVARATAIGVQ